MTTRTDILLIEDEPNIAEAIRFILSRDGWRLEHWPEGGAALERIGAFRPRLVILDVMLPARSGIEVLAALREDAALSSTPVLLRTARGLTVVQDTASDETYPVPPQPVVPTAVRRIVAEMLGTPE